jgi:hypothetical protein
MDAMRKRKMHAALCLLALGAGVVWCAAPGLLLTATDADPTAAEEQAARKVDLVAQFRPRLEAKEQATRRFLAGELTLLQAAAYFRLANQQPGPTTDRSKVFFPGQSEEEKLCRQVIAWVSSKLNGEQHPQHWEIVAALQDELEEHIREHGQPTLPKVETFTAVPSAAY